MTDDWDAEDDIAFSSDERTVALSSKSTLPAELMAKKKKPEERKVHLVVLSGSEVGKLHQIGQGLTAIGRDNDNNIQIMDGGISRHHSLIFCDIERDAIEIRDLNSRNGTFVNDVRVEESAPLKRGDKIQLGMSTVLRVSFGDELETAYAQQMYEAVLRDGLTGIYNRRYLDERIDGEIAFSKRHKTVLSMVIFDIDHFKSVNDNYGHPAGDAVLKQLAARVAETIRTEDVLARYGGEEFAILCRDINEDDATLLGERLRLHVEVAPFDLPDGTELSVTVSVGVSELREFSTAKELIDAADKALYRAKETGRNQVIRFSEL